MRIPVVVARDKSGVLSDLAIACDVGRTDYANFLALKRFITSPARTDVFVFSICVLQALLLRRS